jgi:hypothetical protein
MIDSPNGAYISDVVPWPSFHGFSLGLTCNGLWQCQNGQWIEVSSYCPPINGPNVGGTDSGDGGS